MTASPTQRRLAAILAADVVGYSKLMADDEAGTLAALRQHREDLFNPETQKHGGRIVKLMGDGSLVEFPSVVDAVEAALSIQTALADDSGAIKLRIGINLGDVVIDGEDIYGDGVNIAARLEAMAAPGGICISSVVHESLGNRIDTAFTDIGEQSLKNIDRPIRVFQWSAVQSEDNDRSRLVPMEVRQDRTIAVGEFENLSSDDEIGFFCDGIGQDLITAFGTIEQLTVVSEQHGTKEKAQYLLTGKVRKGGTRLRVSAQLIDRQSGIQRWADRYDRDADDLFTVQDDITRNIVIAIHTELGAGSYTNRWQWGTENFDAWQLAAKGFAEFQKFSPESLMRTIEYAEKALQADPDYLAPLMMAGYCYGHLSLTADCDLRNQLIEKADAAFTRSHELRPDDVRPFAVKRALAFAQGDYDTGVAAARQALAMAPNDSYTEATLGFALASACEPEEALGHLTKAARDMTSYPGWFGMARILCHYMLGDLNEAVRCARETMVLTPTVYPARPLAAAAAADLDDFDGAEAYCRETLDMDPQFSVRQFVRFMGLKDAKISDRLNDALRKAGLPE